MSSTSKPNAKLRADYESALRQQEKLSEKYKTQKEKLDALREALNSAGVSLGEFKGKQGSLTEQIARNERAQHNR